MKTAEGTGFVSLVGAGPGDPELLTLKAARRLAKAELVLYDALVSPRVLELAPRARRFFVGKRAGRKSMKQETIHRLMIRAARRGERVVRLKCGDPFVLGRGGEESLALADAGVPFEVVPGVSSAIAAPELAGIPVTHRGLASGFAVFSGHAEAAYAPIADAVAPGSLTLVVLMGVKNRARIAQRLLDRGWAPRTPVALCFAASTPESRTVETTLKELALAESSAVAGAEGDDPGTLVIGEVVAVAERIAQPFAAKEACDGSRR